MKIAFLLISDVAYIFKKTNTCFYNKDEFKQNEFKALKL